MEYNKLISVVMPVHNGERFLSEAIESVLSQTYTNFELLIIENCSSDSSVEIIQSYNDKRIRLIIEEDCGIPQAYNRGFKEAVGEYVLVHDQDDVSHINRLEKLLGYVIKKKLDMCGSSFNIIDSKGQYIKTINPPQNNEEIKEKIFYNFFTLFNPTIIVKKNILERLGYFNEIYDVGSDYDFIIKTLYKNKCGNNNNILLYYRIHENNASKKDTQSGGRKVKKIALTHLEYFIPFFYDSDFVLSRIYFFYGNYYYSLNFLLKSVIKKGIELKKIKIFLLSTVFLLPVWLVRKRGLYYNKLLNKLYNSIKKIGKSQL